MMGHNKGLTIDNGLCLRELFFLFPQRLRSIQLINLNEEERERRRKEEK